LFDLREKVDCPAVRRHPSNNVEMSGSWVENAVINYIALARVDWKGVKRKARKWVEKYGFNTIVILVIVLVMYLTAGHCGANALCV